MALDRHEFAQRLCERGGLLVELIEFGQIKQRLRRLLVAGKVEGNVLDCFKPSGLKGDQVVECYRAIWLQLIKDRLLCMRQRVPGGISVFDRDLAVESRPARVPGRPAGRGRIAIIEFAHVIEQSLVKELRERTKRAPIEPQEASDRLQRLAEHRIAAQLPNLVDQKGRDRRVERRQLGDEIEHRCRGEDGRRVASECIEKEILIEAVEEDEMDRCSLTAGFVRRRQFDQGPECFIDPIK